MNKRVIRVLLALTLICMAAPVMTAATSSYHRLVLDSDGVSDGRV